MEHFAEYLNAGVTFVVGFIALLVYVMQRHHERLNAAKIILSDIRHAEGAVLALVERQQLDIWMREVLRENNWPRYRHLLANHLSSDDLAAFNRFFSAGVEMSDARQRMRDVHYAALDEKARILQQELSKIETSGEPAFTETINKIEHRINRALPLFIPNEPRERYLLQLQQMGRLSNTVGFDRLRKLAREK